MTTEHTADEAGGEAVFAYDGLPSLALPPPPIGGTTTPTTSTDDEASEAVIIEEQKFRTAFETFNESNTGWMGLCHPTKNHVIEVPGGSVVSGTNVGWEDPRRKLYQLKVDIDNLERQFDNEAQLQHGSGGEGPEEEELKAATFELKSRLTSLGLSDATSLANLLNGRQSDLSSVISNDVAKFNNDGSIDAGMENLSLKGESKEGDSTGEGGASSKIVYELYRDAKSTSTTNVPREAMLEERLRKLELAMGSTTTSSTSDGGNKSIMERIEAAERLTSEVDTKQIDKLASKAKVIRADLEAAARAKNKLSSKSSSNTYKDSQLKEDANVISALHTQLQELEGLSQHLPSLTNRLVELQTLHLNASNFSSRLDSAEEAVSRCEGMLSNVEGSLSNMENGWKSNMELIEKNVDSLDKLLSDKTSQS